MTLTKSIWLWTLIMTKMTRFECFSFLFLLRFTWSLWRRRSLVIVSPVCAADNVPRVTRCREKCELAQVFQEYDLNDFRLIKLNKYDSKARHGDLLNHDRRIFRILSNVTNIDILSWKVYPAESRHYFGLNLKPVSTFDSRTSKLRTFGSFPIEYYVHNLLNGPWRSSIYELNT